MNTPPKPVSINDLRILKTTHCCKSFSYYGVPGRYTTFGIGYFHRSLQPWVIIASTFLVLGYYGQAQYSDPGFFLVPITMILTPWSLKGLSVFGKRRFILAYDDDLSHLEDLDEEYYIDVHFWHIKKLTDEDRIYIMSKII